MIRELTCNIRENELLIGQAGMGTPSSDSLDRGFQSKKSALLERCGDLCANTIVDHAFMHYNGSPSLPHALENRLSVPRIDGAQIDELHVHSFHGLFDGGDGGGAEVQRLAVGDDCQIFAGLDDLGLAQWNCVVFVGDVLHGSSVENLGLHEHHGVIVFEDG